MAMERIPLHISILNQRTLETVNARDLHAFLGIKTDFSKWLSGRIARYGFYEGEDFSIVEQVSSLQDGSAQSRTQALKDYYVSLDMAQELALLECSDKGKEVRRYFIEYQYQLCDPAKLPVSNSPHTQTFLDKYQILNHIARSMKVDKNIAVLPASDIMNLVNQLRYYQQQIASMQTDLYWIDESIERVKQAAGRGFADGM